MAAHVALLGDSIFDNRTYTGGEPDVIEHLRSLLPAGWQASLLAVDGCTSRSLAAQLARVPANASHLMISLGGNDALMNRDLLNRPVASTAEALGLFAERMAAFESAYRSAIDAALGLGRETTLCTIYRGNFGPEEALAMRPALALFNDVILGVALARRLPVIDLRLVCSEPADYANPIEPSGSGGRKIAAAIVETLGIARPPASPGVAPPAHAAPGMDPSAASTSVYYRAVCEDEAAAVHAYETTEGIFDSLAEVGSYARKCSGAAILYRFDDPPATVARILERLRGTGCFREVAEISPNDFWRAKSRGV
jgi:hypothetical protein